ncbi:MAG: adenosylmethionine--8-amino-7-oxononanoate transaminase [Pseudomonadota bacterium]|nr:adenosylmethionine--8-amino-7-oxononanoate transaminase [Pseudomonadota bacterium]
MIETNADLRDRDLHVFWHPCSQMKDHETLPLIPIRRAKGVWLEDFEGHRYLDAISSWWVNIFGHGHPHIDAGIRAQLDALAHVITAGFTHEPAVALAERLVRRAPPGLTRVFYAENGSSAVEIALKMSFHAWRNQGHHGKTRFVSLTNGYHGETLGALAVGGVDLYRDTYGPLLMPTLQAPSPDCYLRPADTDWECHSRNMLEPMAALLETRHAEICAVIVEPLVQCAGNMRMYHPAYLRGLRELCDRYDVHLIADEIAVGFGRTGTFFACEQADITPDFLCTGKGLTGGYLPLSAVLTGEAIYDCFYDDYATLRAFLHSHSYTANALGCAAALATLDLFDTQPVLASNQALATHLAEALAPLRDHPHVGEVRQTGLIAAVEMTPQGDRHSAYAWQERRGLRVYRHALTQGMLLRPLGNVVYFMPPYVITPKEIDRMVAVACEGIDRATAD